MPLTWSPTSPGIRWTLACVEMIKDGMKHAKEIVDMFKDAALVISLD